MTTAEEIRWGKYKQYEGPFHQGKCRYVLPASPTKNERLMAVMSATEGGRYDAFNGYDVCGWTSGIIQWCEMGQYSVSDMLGQVAVRTGAALSPLSDMLEERGLQFKTNARGRWRFHFKDARGEVDRKQEQQQLFYLDGDGTKGTWHEENTKNAKEWAAAISSVWENEAAQKCQLDFTVPRMQTFAFGRSKEVVQQAPDTEIGEAFVAAYISFAGNNPARANKHLGIAMDSTEAEVYSLDWLVAVLKELTFGPQIAIYPHRYNAIRPVLEHLYGIDLPDLAEELKSWQAGIGLSWVLETVELQRALISLGYDLGPAGADNKFGAKTKDAVLTFEQLHHVPDPDGYPGPLTVQLIEKELEARGLAQLANAPG